MKPDRKGMVRLARKLISIDTTNPPAANYSKAVSVIRDECLSLGMKCRVVYGNGRKDKPNLLCSMMRGSSAKTLHLINHFDTVPVSAGWKRQPFSGEIIGGRMYGRGAYDQKALIAAMLYAIKAARLSVNIQASFVCDEETGGADGAGYLAKKGLFKADWVLGEGSSGRNFAIGSKGVLWADITVIGRSGHAAIPWTGKNAFTDAIALVRALEALGRRISKRKTHYMARFEKNRRASLVIGGLVSGTSKRNMIPDRFTFSIDRRILPEESVRKAKKEIDDALKQAGRIRYRREWVQEHQPYVNTSESFAALFRSCVARHYRNPREVLLPGMDDKRFFMGKPMIGYSVDGRNMHGDDEYASIESMYKTSEIYAEVITRL